MRIVTLMLSAFFFAGLADYDWQRLVGGRHPAGNRSVGSRIEPAAPQAPGDACQRAAALAREACR